MAARRPRVLVADPPWPFKDKLPGKSRGAAKNYELMTLQDICLFPLPALADHCVLVLWRVASMQAEAITVGRAWGFEGPKAEIVWAKTTNDHQKLRPGMGRRVRNAHEVALIFERGKPKRLAADVPSVIFAPRQDHSQKPEVVYRAIERLWGGPYHELFARRERKGWRCEGHQAVAPATMLCPDCDGVGWYEGGETLQTPCKRCKGSGEVPAEALA